jgi:alpha-ketoglutarate-dependent taurine dioxygenase
MVLEVTPLNEPLGAVVHGWEPHASLSNRDVDVIRGGLRAHAVLVFRGHEQPTDDQLVGFAETFTRGVGKVVPKSAEAVGPSPCPISRIKGKYRYVSIFRGTGMRELRAELRFAALKTRCPKGVSVHVDADPVNLM